MGIIDPLGHRSLRFYDGEDHIIETAQAKHDLADFYDQRIVNKYTYDKNNNLIQSQLPQRSSEDPNELYMANYEYDSQQRLWKDYDFRGNFQEYTYTEKHQIETIKDKKGIPIARYSYNDDGTLKMLSDANGQITSYSDYDNYGNAQTISRPMIDGTSPIERFTYNERGDLISQTDPNGNT